jgi:hypothetical protein
VLDLFERAIDPCILEIGTPHLLDWDHYRVIGYYTGFNGLESKAGFRKNLDSYPSIGYEIHYPKASALVLLEDNRLVAGSPSALKEQLKMLDKGVPIEVRLFPRIGYIGFFGGIGGDNSLLLYGGYNKQTHEFEQPDDMALIARWDCVKLIKSNPNYEKYRFKPPKLEQIVHITTLKEGSSMPAPSPYDIF